MCVRGVTRLYKHQSNNSNSKNSFKLENTKQISRFNLSFHQHHLGGNKEEGSKVLTFSLHIRNCPPQLHVTRDWTSKAGSCLLGARFKLLFLLGFTVIWHLEILLNTPVNAITLQIIPHFVLESLWSDLVEEKNLFLSLWSLSVTLAVSFLRFQIRF